MEMHSDSVCRLCLAVEADNKLLSLTPVQEWYEKVTNNRLNTKKMPVTVCYICYAQLNRCYKFMVKCTIAEITLIEILNTQTEITPKSVSAINREAEGLTNHLSVTMVKHENFPLNIPVLVKSKLIEQEEIDIEMEIVEDMTYSHAENCADNKVPLQCIKDKSPASLNTANIPASSCDGQVSLPLKSDVEIEEWKNKVKLLQPFEDSRNSEMSDIEDDDEKLVSRLSTPEPPPYSPLSSPNSYRSRSPISIQQPTESPTTAGVVLRIYNDIGMPLEKQGHNLFVFPEEHEAPVLQGLSRGRGRRSARRGGRRGARERGERGRGARGAQRRGRGDSGRWEIGKPLTEIYMTDDDVPEMDVIRNREARVRERNERERNDSDNEDDEFVDASEEGFVWTGMNGYECKEEKFLPDRTGSCRIFESAYEAFRSYWDDDILNLIVSETNQHARNIASVHFQAQWVETNMHEILCLFAMWMMLGIIRMPTIASCFTTEPLLKTEVFRKIFTLKRFEHLSRALDFIDAGTDRTNQSLDRIYRLRPVVDHLNKKFQENYILGRDICIDESLTLWKGRLDIKQYIRSKAARFGIKTFELCESVTGYLWSFIVYTGKQSSADLEQAPGVLKSTAVVKKLMAPLLNKGHRLFMDNWYNSPLLARFLKRNGTDCVGTLRPSRRDVPALINEAPLKRGEIVARHSGDVAVLAWQDKKRITMISTCHGSTTALPRVSSHNSQRPVPFKPQMVLDYNKYMGGVDLKDQMLEPYLLERKQCAKWYLKIFKRLLNVSILNSRILLQSSARKPYNHLAFRIHLVDSILSHHLHHVPLSRKQAATSSGLGGHLPGSHWPISLEQPNASSEPKQKARKRCVVCLSQGRKNVRTNFSCESCKVPLCVLGCFKTYHTSS